MRQLHGRADHQREDHVALRVEVISEAAQTLRERVLFGLVVPREEVRHDVNEPSDGELSWVSVWVIGFTRARRDVLASHRTDGG